MNAKLKLVRPANQNRSVHPTRPPNAELRTREHLLPAEIDKLMAAARKHSRYPDRDATLILVIYRHGLRASEACDLEWSQIDFDTATMHVRRLKNGKPATHPIRGDEMRATQAAARDYRALCLHLRAWLTIHARSPKSSHQAPGR
jgi:type 1 fimbriae regulatory protein FimB/type 1 fimbriae regulatory protein FimE